MILFFLFTISIIEIALFILMGDILGLWGTVLVVFVTAWIGARLVKKQGINTLISAQHTVNQGKAPLKEMYAGVCLLVAGALLVTPGFLTDGVGLLLLLPWFRDFLGVYLINKILQSPHFKMRSSFTRTSSGGFQGGFDAHTRYDSHHFSKEDDGIIEGDFIATSIKKDANKPKKD